MLPNADGYAHDPAELRRMVRRTGLSQARVARIVGVKYRTLKYYLRRKGGGQAPYSVFYAITILALVQEKIGQPLPPRAAF